jgi:lipopolysaccharide transport system permease protein
VATVTRVSERAAVWQASVDALGRRYRRTYLGWPWLVVRPVLGSLGATFLFSGVLDIQTESGEPYLLFVLGGMAMWTLLDTSLVLLTRSLDATRALRRTIRIAPASVLVAFLFPAAVQLVIMAALFVVLTGWFRIGHGDWYVELGLRTLLLPVAVVAVLFLALGIGAFTSVLGEGNRDTRWALNYVMSPWLYVTPVLYPLSVMPDDLKWTAAVNPAALPVLLGREAIFGDSGITRGVVAGGTIGIVTVLAIGCAFVVLRRRPNRARELAP